MLTFAASPNAEASSDQVDAVIELLNDICIASEVTPRIVSDRAKREGWSEVSRQTLAAGQDRWEIQPMFGWNIDRAGSRFIIRVGGRQSTTLKPGVPGETVQDTKFGCSIEATEVDTKKLAARIDDTFGPGRSHTRWLRRGTMETSVRRPPDDLIFGTEWAVAQGDKKYQLVLDAPDPKHASSARLEIHFHSLKSLQR